MNRLKRHVGDAELLRLINRYLKAGVSVNGQREASPIGVRQGGPLSPILANVVLDELDWELDRRGHRFARYADDCNIVVASKRAGGRVMISVKRFVEDSLRLTVNADKSAVDRPWNRKFLGFTVTHKRIELKLADQSIDKLEARVRALTRRTRGHRLVDIVAELRETLLGWKAYFGIAEVLSPLRDIDKWIRRKLRCYHWKQWGRAGYRELRRRGVSQSLGGELSEMRVNVGPGYRLYFTRRGSVLIIMLAGDDKSSQARDIRRARQILKMLEPE